MPISRRDLIKKLKDFNFTGPFSGGRHQFMVKGTQKLRIPNPHKSQDITDALLNEILRQAGITRSEFDKYSFRDCLSVFERKNGRMVI
uniref:type II toxin-antitoxin system HicA family toxin n=1 Tax=Candidatus Electrothrix sp. TaxID=2170559 RepID=UPI004055EC3A